MPHVGSSNHAVKVAAARRDGGMAAENVPRGGGADADSTLNNGNAVAREMPAKGGRNPHQEPEASLFQLAGEGEAVAQ